MSTLVSIKTFVKELEAALNRKDGYIMGARGQNPRTGYLDLSKTSVKSSWKENGYYYTQYNSSQYTTAQRNAALRWRKTATRVWDCNGMAEGIYELHTGVNIDSKARFNYSQWCSVKGSGMIPEKYRVPGAAVFWSSEPKSNPNAGNIHHVAYLYKPVKEGHPTGDWYIIEAKGVAYGVVQSRLYSRKPNFWGLMTKYYDYSGATEDPAIDVPKTSMLGDRVLKNGDEGEDVKQLQTNLIRLGFSCGKWGSDGDFGDSTELAVEEFQKKYNVGKDGVFNKECYEKMMKVLSEDVDAPVENPKKVQIVGGQCYVRTKPNITDGIKMGVAKEHTVWDYAGETSTEGWLKIDFNGKKGWVSGKYGKLVK